MADLKKKIEDEKKVAIDEKMKCDKIKRAIELLERIGNENPNDKPNDKKAVND